MSCNVLSSDYLGAGRLRMDYALSRRLVKRYELVLPEVSFFAGMGSDGEVKEFHWYGEGSGHTYDDLLPKLLGKTLGEAVLLFHWEGGEQSALVVKDGVVKAGKVVISVEAE